MIFRSQGKLLLTGEYAVLYGAKSLALPTKYGQELEVIPNDSGKVIWTSLDVNSNSWFETEFLIRDIKTGLSKNFENLASERLYKLLCYSKSQNKKFLESGCQVITRLNFERLWGLGTSSTLVNNIAVWANVNPYKLLWSTFRGSGYDIACAIQKQPILYQLKNSEPIVQKIKFSPEFSKQIYFVYLNKKQNTHQEILKKKEVNTGLVNTISTLTDDILASQSLHIFENKLTAHESLIGDYLGISTIQKLYFKDYNQGVIKSLGAWGGDFVLITGDENSKDYFRKKGYKTIIDYKTMCL